MARGINTGGDVVTRTVDGVDLTSIWTDMQATIAMRNNNRDGLRAILTYSTTAVGDQVPQTSVLDDFETASEFGVPHSVRAGITTLTLGFNFIDRDLAARYSWRFLRDADAGQVEAVHQAALDADSRQLFQSVMGAVLNNTARLNPEGLAIQPLWSNDGVVPPEWNGVTFLGSHDHYLVSGSAVFDGGDVRDAYQAVAHHGYGTTDVGGQVIVFLNPVQAEMARGFKKGAAATDPFDFIPGPTAPAYLTDQVLVGDKPPANVGAIPIMGQYGSALRCPAVGCGGVLGPWGRARVRVVRGAGRLRPRRTRRGGLRAHPCAAAGERVAAPGARGGGSRRGPVGQGRRGRPAGRRGWDHRRRRCGAGCAGSRRWPTGCLRCWRRSPPSWAPSSSRRPRPPSRALRWWRRSGRRPSRSPPEPHPGPFGWRVQVSRASLDRWLSASRRGAFPIPPHGRVNSRHSAGYRSMRSPRRAAPARHRPAGRGSVVRVEPRSSTTRTTSAPRDRFCRWHYSTFGHGHGQLVTNTTCSHFSRWPGPSCVASGDS